MRADQGKVVETGMNIANLSLDRVGKKAQGINRALISIVNQQEEGESGRTCERLCMSKTEQGGVGGVGGKGSSHFF